MGRGSQRSLARQGTTATLSVPDHEEGGGSDGGTARDLATEIATPIAFRTVNSELEHRVHQLAKIAPTNAAVLIRGETGTGKELIRELEQALLTATALTDTGEIHLEHLPEAIRTYQPGPTVTAILPEDQALGELLIKLLREHGGNGGAIGSAMNRRRCRSAAGATACRSSYRSSGSIVEGAASDSAGAQCRSRPCAQRRLAGRVQEAGARP